MIKNQTVGGVDTVDEVIAEDRVAEAEVPVSSTLETTVKGTTKVANAIISKVVNAVTKATMAVVVIAVTKATTAVVVVIAATKATTEAVNAVTKATTAAAAAATTGAIAAHGTALADPSVEHLEVVPEEDRRTGADTNATRLLKRLKREKPNKKTVIYHHSE